MGKLWRLSYSFRKKTNNFSGFTLIEVLACIGLFAIVAYLSFSGIQNSTLSFRKANLNVSANQSQALALQKLSQSGILKQILSTKLSAPELDNYRKCVLGSGANCMSSFDGRTISLTLDPAHPLAKEFNGAFGRDLSSCSDPVKCDKSYTRSTALVINCDSDLSCPHSKLLLTTEIGAKNRLIEIPLSATDLFTVGLNGACALNQGYVSEIDYANNSIKCADGSDALNIVPTGANCNAPVANDGYILAGVKGTSFAPSNDCQVLALSDWSVVSGYPSIDTKYSTPVTLPILPPGGGGSSSSSSGGGASSEAGSTSTNPVGSAVASRFILWGDEHAYNVSGNQSHMPELGIFWNNALNILTAGKGGHVGILRLGPGTSWGVNDAADFIKGMGSALDSKFIITDFDITKNAFNDFDAVIMMEMDETKLSDPMILKNYVDSGHGLIVGIVGLLGMKNLPECQMMNRILADMPYVYDCNETTANLDPTSSLFAGIVSVKRIPFEFGHWVIKNHSLDPVIPWGGGIAAPPGGASSSSSSSSSAGHQKKN